MDIKKLKVPELKEKLSERGLSTAGKKDELVARLESAIADEAAASAEPAAEEAAPVEAEPAPEPEAPEPEAPAEAPAPAGALPACPPWGVDRLRGLVRLASARERAF